MPLWILIPVTLLVIFIFCIPGAEERQRSYLIHGLHASAPAGFMWSPAAVETTPQWLTDVWFGLWRRKVGIICIQTVWHCKRNWAATCLAYKVLTDLSELEENSTVTLESIKRKTDVKEVESERSIYSTAPSPGWHKCTHYQPVSRKRKVWNSKNDSFQKGNIKRPPNEDLYMVNMIQKGFFIIQIKP